MAIKCGHCGEHHSSVQGVRECSQGKLIYEREHPSGSMDDNPPDLNRKIEEGMWYWGKRIVKVQRAVHGSGRLYTKELVKTGEQNGNGQDTWEFQLLRGGLYKLLKEPDVRRMTLEEAVEFGKLYGICVRCHRTLTKETSIEQGMGDICAGKI